MAITQRIAPCLWFDDQAEEAARYYVEIFKNSRITTITRYGKAGFEQHMRPEGSVMLVMFELDGQQFMALNGGPVFRFNESVSFVVTCADQEEIDYYWDRLSAGGDPRAQQCGWLKDKYGLSWQVIPDNMEEVLADAGSPGAERAFAAVMGMKKIDVAAMMRAHEGTG
jgi:predicted 3-demethylubiquinone-9 3-methyltransferase (glyoxalase superfamily)